MVINGSDGKPVVTPRPKNPGVPRMKFNQLVARLVALEARVVKLEAEKAEEPAADSAEKDALVARAVELKIDAPSNLKRWGVEKLQAEIAKAEGKE